MKLVYIVMVAALVAFAFRTELRPASAAHVECCGDPQPEPCPNCR